MVKVTIIKTGADEARTVDTAKLMAGLEWLNALEAKLRAEDEFLHWGLDRSREAWPIDYIMNSAKLR